MLEFFSESFFSILNKTDTQTSCQIFIFSHSKLTFQLNFQSSCTILLELNSQFDYTNFAIVQKTLGF